MSVPTNIREQLLRDEGGCVLRPYPDSLGLLTIGVGHCLDTDPRWKSELLHRCGGDPALIEITQEEAERVFDHDLAQAIGDVMTSLPWTRDLDEPRFAVLVGMRFNMGLGSSVSGKGLLGFRRMLRAAERRDYAEAAVEMLASKWARQVKARAVRLSHQMLTGAWV